MNQRTTLLLSTLAIAGLVWVDALYLPLVLLGPLLFGAVAGAKGVSPRAAALPWLAAGLITLVVDLAANGEDVAFHAAAAVFTAVVTAGAAALAHRTRAPRTRAAALTPADAAPTLRR